MLLRDPASDLAEHISRSGDVEIFTTVRSAHEGQIRIVEGIQLEASRFEDRECLSGLGCATEQGWTRRIAERKEEATRSVHDRSVDEVTVFYHPAAIGLSPRREREPGGHEVLRSERREDR